MLWRNFRVWLQGLGTCLVFSSRRQPRLTTKNLRRDIELQLQRQFADAAAKSAASWHWGTIGGDIQGAAQAASGILPMQANEGLQDYFDRVLPAMAQLAERYRRSTMDADGYGLGTVRELEEMIKAKAELFRAQTGKD